MAKRITDEKMNVEMSINGVNETQAQISKIRTSVRELEAANKDLAAAKRKEAIASGTQSDKYKLLHKQQQQNKVAIDEYTSKQNKLQKQLGLTGMTVRQLTRHHNRLKSQMDAFVPNTPEWEKLNREYKEAGRRLNDVRGEMKQTEGVMAGMRRQLGGFGGLFLGGAGLMAAWQGLKRLVRVNAELSDAQANVMKTTGLTEKQVESLTGTLKKFDTRTPINALLALAEEAGRLGKESVEDIMGFVRTADMISVALGDDLKGDINETVQLIGKLSTQYQVGEKYGVGFGEGMEKVGSAINEVAASGANQADFLVDYLSRLVGVSAQTKMTAAEQLGFAAALDEAGQKVEVSASTVSRVITDMYIDPTEYAAIAGEKLEDFIHLLDTDANAAFLKFLDGLKNNEEGFRLMTKKLEELGLEGTRNTDILSTLASNIDNVRAKQEIANKAIEEGTSLTQEFNVKNANLAGNLDKIGNAIGNYFKNSRLTSWLTKVTGGLVAMNKATNVQSNLLRDQQFELNVLVGSITSLNKKNDARGRLIKELQKTYPDFLANLNAEKITNGQLKDRLIEVNAQYREKIRLVAFGEEIAENQSKAVKLQREELDRIKAIEKLRVMIGAESGKNMRETVENIKELSGMSGKIFARMTVEEQLAAGAGAGAETHLSRILEIRTKIAELEKESIGLQKEKSKIKIPGEEQVNTPTLPPEGPVEPTPPEADTTSFDRAKAEADREKEIYKNKEEQLNEFIEQKRIERKIAHMEGIKQELARIDEKYRREIERAKGHAEEEKALIALREQEKNDAKLQLQKEYLERSNQIEEENRLLKEEAAMEREVAQAETKLEKDQIRLEYAREYALQELEIQKQLELSKVEVVKNSEELKAAIRKNYALQVNKINTEFDKQEQNLRSDQVTWTEMTEQQKADAVMNSLSLIAGAFNRGSEAWKAVKIAETLIATQQAAVNAYSFMAAIGGPILGAIGAAAATAAGLRKVQVISSTELQKMPKPTPKKVTGYEDGLYSDITRTDGKRFRAKNMGRTSTQVVNEPSYFQDYLAGEAGPELIVDNATFRKLDPGVVDHILNVHHQVKGYAGGLYPTNPEAAPTASSDPELKALMALMFERLSEPIKTYTVYGYDDEENRQKIQDEIATSKQNGNLS